MRKKQSAKPELEPKATMRVSIAKDVIAQIKAKKFQVISANGYCKIPEGVKADIPFSKQLKGCEVCALGAMFLSDVRKDKSFVPHVNEHFISYITINERLGSYFEPDQLEMIENAFENDELEGDDGQYYCPYESYDDDTTLTKICENIIRNDGTFVPEQDA